MISSIDVKSASGAVLASLRLTTGSMIRLEREFDLPIHQVIAKFDTGGSITLIVGIFAAAMNNGAGGTEAEAMDQIDQLGGAYEVAGAVGQAVAAAFPKPKPKPDGEVPPKTKPVIDGEAVDLGEPVGNVKKPSRKK